jgi:hypothetical protein
LGRKAGNPIAFNGDYGVLVVNASKDAILSNSIYGNGTDRIGLFGGNNDQAAPTLNSAVASGRRTTLSGSLPQARTWFLLQVFKDVPNGQVLVFSGMVRTDKNGNFRVRLNHVKGGDELMATATVRGNTSAFAADLTVTQTGRHGGHLPAVVVPPHGD